MRVGLFIYVVKSGESIFSIAQKFDVTMASIRITNGLSSDAIVPGQDLLIPTTNYIVQPGDSLFSIAKMAMLPVETVRQYNGISGDAISIGMELYLPPREKYTSENLSYLLPASQETSEEILAIHGPLNTYFGIFEYHFDTEGNLSTLYNDELLVRLSRQNRVAPLAAITNLTPEGFNPELTRIVLTSPEKRERLLNNIVNLVRSKNYTGVNIDFERLQEDERDRYSSFLMDLGNRLRPQGFTTSAAVPAKTSDAVPWLKAYDYGSIGAAVDLFFIMAYDWHEVSSLPGPVSPLPEVRRTVEFAITQMGSKKIILGVPRYGYDWLMANGSVASARAVSVASAYRTAMDHSVPISYSDEYEQPFYEYWDRNGDRHIVWFEDAKARAEKLKLVVAYGLLGVGAWQLGLHFTQSAELIEYFFNVRKTI